MQKAKERFSKEKAAKYYGRNKEAIKEKPRVWYENLPKEDKGKIKEYQRKRYQELIQYKKQTLKVLFSSEYKTIRQSDKTLKFDNIRVNKKKISEI